MEQRLRRFGIDGNESAYDVDGALQRTAQMFRLYVSQRRQLSVITKDVVPSRNVIEVFYAHAQAWVATTLNAMNAKKTLAYRSKWFGGRDQKMGGSGESSADAVRRRLLRAFNFANRELMDGAHLVYVKGGTGYCEPQVLAFVVRWVGDKPGEYYESEGPVCEANDRKRIFNYECAIDPGGRFFVYLCEILVTREDETTQTMALIHEIIHHTGPRDQSYDPSVMQRSMTQHTQFNNAGNYEYFARDVTLKEWGGCEDKDNAVSSGYDCGSKACTCRHVTSYCNSDRRVREWCQASCGLCSNYEGAAADGGDAGGGGGFDGIGGSLPGTTWWGGAPSRPLPGIAALVAFAALGKPWSPPPT